MAQRPQQRVAQQPQLSHSNTIGNMSSVKDDGDISQQKLPPPPSNLYNATVEYTQNVGNIISNGIGNTKKTMLNIHYVKWLTALFVLLYMGFILVTLSTIHVIESDAMIVISSVMASFIFMLHCQYMGRAKESKKTAESEGENLNWVDMGIYLSAAIFGMSELNVYIKNTLDETTRNWVSVLNITLWSLLTIFLILSRQIHFKNIMEFAKYGAAPLPQV